MFVTEDQDSDVRLIDFGLAYPGHMNDLMVQLALRMFVLVCVCVCVCVCVGCGGGGSFLGGGEVGG